MRHFYTRLALVFVALFLATVWHADAQTHKRVVVLPFDNDDGKIALNLWRYELADSLRTLLISMDESEEHYHIVDPDSVEMAISEFNLDPTNAQYESDVWRAVELLQATHVVQGNFLMRGERVLMNCYLYDVEFKTKDPENMARDIFKTEETYLSAVKKMAKSIYPGLTK